MEETVLKTERQGEDTIKMDPKWIGREMMMMIIIIIIIIIIIMVLQPLVVPWPLYQFLDPIHSR
jgi:uncharacterized protein HemY